MLTCVISQLITLRGTGHPLGELNHSACSDLTTAGDDPTHPIEDAAVSNGEMVSAFAKPQHLQQDEAGWLSML